MHIFLLYPLALSDICTRQTAPLRFWHGASPPDAPLHLPKQRVSHSVMQVADMGDRCATDDELNRARLNLKKLEDLTRLDHVRHADQLVAQVRIGGETSW